MNNSSKSSKKRKSVKKVAHGVAPLMNNVQFISLRNDLFTDIAIQTIGSRSSTWKVDHGLIVELMLRLFENVVVGESKVGTLLGFYRMATSYAGKLSGQLFSPEAIEFFRAIEERLKSEGRIVEVDALCPRLSDVCRDYVDELVLDTLAHLIILTIIEIFDPKNDD